MIASLRPACAGVLLLACGWSALATASQSSSTSEPASSACEPTSITATSAIAAPTAGGRDEDEEIQRLVTQIRSSQDKAKERLFGQLTAYKNKASLDAMTSLVKSVVRPDVLKVAFHSFENYKGAEGVEKLAIKFVADQCDAGGEFLRHAAVEGLTRFGTSAEDELYVLVNRSKDPIVRAWALRPLLEDLKTQATPDALKMIVENAQTGYTGRREDLLATLEFFDGDKNMQAFAAALKSKKVPDWNKAAIMGVIAKREDPSVQKALVGALKSKSPEVLLAAMKALDERAQPVHIAALQKLVKAKDEGVRRQAIVSLGLYRGGEEGWLKELQKLAKAKDSASRMGAASALAEMRTPEALEHLYKLLNDADHLVQGEAVQQIGNLRRKETLPALIARINGASGRLRMQILTTLRLITGLDNGTSKDRWETWWKRAGKDFEVPSYEDALAAENDRDRRRSESKTVSTFYGLQIVSDRICFIMDVSGSMREPAEKGGGGGNRLSVAKKQLSSVLETYPNGDLFNLIFFSSDAYGWEDELVRMNEDNRAEALKYVERQRPDGATAIYDALKLAFEDQRIDTIFILTDGEPMGGTENNPARIREEVATWNAARHIRINSIAVGQASPLLRGLSEDTGGEYREE